MSWGLTDVSVTYGDHAAVLAVSVEISPSTVTVLIGGDGAGKTTCLKALVGLLPIAGGHVSCPQVSALGYVPETGGFYPDLTVDENLRFAGQGYGLEGAALTAQIGDIGERIGLHTARERLAGVLSGGMQRKLALGMALMHRPVLLVLDEPTTGIDPVSRAELWRLISGAVATGSAVVLTTTYVNEANRASRIVLLESGRVIASGTPGEIRAAVRGVLGETKSTVRPAGQTVWRQGKRWRVWVRDGVLPQGVKPVEPTFEDAVIVAAFSAADAGRT